ncbi:MAG: cell division protein FtsZ, partial [Caldimonas sp.]
MSTLMIALASVGGVVLAGVVAHGAWQARRAGPKRATLVEREEPSATAPLASDGGAEFDPHRDVDDPAGFADGDDRAEPSLATGRRLSKRLAVPLDALIDAIVPIALEAPMAGETLLAHLPSKRNAGSKRVLVEGLNSGSNEWQPLLLGERYGELQAGVQLASRTGALNEIEYSEFVQRMQVFADAVGAAIEPPDMLDVMARAR